jgi:nitrile hydratase subunit beta
MSDLHFAPMDGVHDLGGMHGFGPVVTPGGERSHDEPWELRAQVLGLLSGAAQRASIEALDPAIYLTSNYYVRWLLAAESSLLGSGVLGEQDLATWHARFKADTDAPMPLSSDPAVVETIRTIGPHEHEPATSPAYSVGDRVQVRRMRPHHHHRCPRYLRGAPGHIEKLLGADPVPGLDTAEPVREPCYTVQFSSLDLFGDRTGDGEPAYVVLIDLWERYLEAPA